MNFLDQFVIPQPEGSLQLLHYMLFLSMLIFFTYTGILHGTTFYSLFFNYLGRKKEDESLIRFSKELINISFYNRNVGLALGFLPILSITLIYIQLLHGLNNDAIGYLIFSTVLMLISILYLNTYNYTFNIESLLGKNKLNIDFDAFHNDEKESIGNFLAENYTIHRRSGLLGTLLLFIAGYIIVGAIQFASNKSAWNNNSAVEILLSPRTLLKYSVYITAAFALANGYVLFYYFKWKNNGSASTGYLDFVKKFSLKWGIINAISLPLFIVADLFVFPNSSLANSIFFLILLSLIAIFFVVHFLYFMFKQQHVNYAASAFFLLIAYFVFLSMNETIAFSTSNKSNELLMAANYENIYRQIAEARGGGAEINGQEIYDARCAACHRFDQVLVGPAYNDVLQKYDGKIEELVKFVLNPVKIDPKFPPMPNQGLKPNEAEAVSKYIMETYKQ